MLAKIAGFVWAVAKWALLAIGALVVALVWWLSSGDGKPAKSKAAEPVAEIVKPAESKAAAPEVVPDAGCACLRGAVCTGPRGGQYCLDADGRKRYKAAQ